MINTPFVDIDVHGMTAASAIAAIDKILNDCGNGVYKVRVNHGFNRGTAIRDEIQKEFGYGYGKVKRVNKGDNPGISELILREM